MATQSRQITGTVVDATVAFSMSANAAYTVQNTGTSALWFTFQTSAPANATAVREAFIVPPLDTVRVEGSTGEKLYLVARDESPTTIAVDDA